MLKKKKNLRNTRKYIQISETQNIIYYLSNVIFQIHLWNTANPFISSTCTQPMFSKAKMLPNKPTSGTIMWLTLKRHNHYGILAEDGEIPKFHPKKNAVITKKKTTSHLLHRLSIAGRRNFFVYFRPLGRHRVLSAWFWSQNKVQVICCIDGVVHIRVWG